MDVISFGNSYLEEVCLRQYGTWYGLLPKAGLKGCWHDILVLELGVFRRETIEMGSTNEIDCSING